MKISICHGELFEYILYYFYTGKIAVNRANVCELIEVANDMVLPRLRGFCAQFLQQTLNPGNCYFVKNVAEKYQLSLLSKTVHSYILTNFTEIINEKEILNFTADEINLLASNLSMPITEETRLRLVCKWIAADVSSRYTQFDRLISHLQWPLFNTKTVYNVIETEKLFTVSEYCMHGILLALNGRERLRGEPLEDVLQRRVERVPLIGQRGGAVRQHVAGQPRLAHHLLIALGAQQRLDQLARIVLQLQRQLKPAPPPPPHTNKRANTASVRVWNSVTKH